MAVEVQFLPFLKVQQCDHTIRRSLFPTGDCTPTVAQNISEIQLAHLEEACADSVTHLELPCGPADMVRPAGSACRPLG